jgi:hypothetical protein
MSGAVAHLKALQATSRARTTVAFARNRRLITWFRNSVTTSKRLQLEVPVEELAFRRLVLIERTTFVRALERVITLD